MGKWIILRQQCSTEMPRSGNGYDSNMSDRIEPVVRIPRREVIEAHYGLHVEEGEQIYISDLIESVMYGRKVEEYRSLQPKKSHDLYSGP